MSDLPTSSGIVANAGTTPPTNPIVKVLEDAYSALKAEVTSPAVEKTLITGIATFLGAEFPPAAPFIAIGVPFLLKLLGAE